MSSLLKKLKSISQWEKDLVTGYNKKAQKLISSNQIPIAISHLCLVYFHEYDYFDKCGNNRITMINDKRNQMSVIKDGGDFVYGKTDILYEKVGMIYSWTFSVFVNGLIMIGISDICGYGDDKETLLNLSWAQYTKAFTTDGIVTMEVNTKKKQMRFYIDGMDQGIAFKNIDFKRIKMKMYVYAEQQGTSIKLIRFSKMLTGR